MWLMWLRGWAIGGKGEGVRGMRGGYARNLQALVCCRPAIRRTLGRPCTARVWFRDRGRGTGVFQSGSWSRKLGRVSRPRL